MFSSFYIVMWLVFHHIAHEGGVGWGGLGLGFHHPNSVWWSHAKRSIHDMVRMKENETSFLETG